MQDEREHRLPAWARDTLKRLRVQLETALEPAVDARRKLEACQAKCQKQSDVLSALQELLFTAAKGGHRTSQEIVSVLESYEVFPPNPKETQ